MCLLLSATAVTLLAGGSTFAEIYDLSDQFPSTSNPEGVWSLPCWNIDAAYYGEMTTYWSNYGGSGLPGWDYGGGTWQPSAVNNNTAADVDIGGGLVIEKGTVMFYPTTGPSSAMAVFTAPSSGEYQVDIVLKTLCAQNTARDMSDGWDGPSAAIYRWTGAGSPLDDPNSAVLTSMEMSLYGDVLSYNNTLTLAAGEQIGVSIYPDGIWALEGYDLAWDAVGVKFTVTAVPEPATGLLIVGGLFGLLAYAWRKRK